jgi:hypothetical protein
MEQKKNLRKDENLISRRVALKKAGYAAFASSTMFLLLNNPTKVYAASMPSDPGDDPFPMNQSSATTSTKTDAWKDDGDPWQ